MHGLPVRIVGVGGGFEYGTKGFSHYGLDDIAVMRTHPNLSVLAPADFEQTRTVLLATWDRAGPIYYRLGKDEQTVVPGLDGRFALGRADARARRARRAAGRDEQRRGRGRAVAADARCSRDIAPRWPSWRRSTRRRRTRWPA